MSDAVLAGRYADAFFEFCDNDRLPHLEGELRLITDVLMDNESLWEFLTSPLIKGSEKQAVFKKVLAVIEPAEEVALFLEFLLKKKRISHLKQIGFELHARVQEFVNMVPCTIETAFDLSEAEQKKIISLLENKSQKKLDVRFEKKAKLIGGISAKVQDKVYEYSIRSKLQDLRKQLLGS